MRYRVVIQKKVQKSADKLPKPVKAAFALLVNDLIEKGPIRSDWNNYSALGKDKYHCHLAYHWVACWTWEKGTIEIEVYYAGSRENAPY